MAIAAKNENGLTAGTTQTSIVTAPSVAGVEIIVPPGGITVYNNDTVAATVTIQYDDNGTNRIIKKKTLQASETMTTDGPIHLDDTNDNLEVLLAGAVTTNELVWNSNYFQKT